MTDQHTADIDPTAFDALEDFAGPGGWDEGARLIGLRFYGVDYDRSACETARAAGHHREQADVTEHASPAWARGKGHVSSPSCTLFSMAGSGIGRLVIDVLAEGITRIFAGEDPAVVRAKTQDAIYPVALAEVESANAKRKPDQRWDAEKVEAKARLDAKIATLVLEPARRVVELDPEWLALEQVPEVLPLWQLYVHELRKRGWSAWAAVLCAADFGVPQTRSRAVLGASRVRKVHPPHPTHSEDSHEADLFGETLLPWISWGEALGLPPEAAIRPARGAGMIARHGSRPDHMASEPAPTVISKARSWEIDRRTNSKGPGGTMVPTVPVPSNRPAPTLTSKAGGQWVLRASNHANAAVRAEDQPAPTMVFARACNDVRIYPAGTEKPGEPMLAADRPAESSRLEVWEAGVLQSFPVTYPWQGTRSKQYEQVGNAIPPLLAAHVLASIVGVPAPVLEPVYSPGSGPGS